MLLSSTAARMALLFRYALTFRRQGTARYTPDPFPQVRRWAGPWCGKNPGATPGFDEIFGDVPMTQLKLCDEGET